MRAFIPLIAALALASCADSHREAKAPPTAADTSAASPFTVNPEPAGRAAPAPRPKADDNAMPPGPVNPKP